MTGITASTSEPEGSCLCRCRQALPGHLVPAPGGQLHAPSWPARSVSERHSTSRTYSNTRCCLIPFEGQAGA